MDMEGEADRSDPRKRLLVDEKHGLRGFPDSYMDRPLKRRRTLTPGAAGREANSPSLNLKQACLDRGAEGRSSMRTLFINKVDSILVESRTGTNTQSVLEAVEGFFSALKEMVANGEVKIPESKSQKEDVEARLKGLIAREGHADSKATLLRSDISALEKEKELWLELKENMSSCRLGSELSDTQGKAQMLDRIGNLPLGQPSTCEIDGAQSLYDAAHELWHYNKKKEQIFRTLHEKLDEAVRVQKSFLAIRSEEFFAMLPEDRDPKQAMRVFLGASTP